MRTPPSRIAGFTLLELLIALSIFGFISAMAFSGLSSVSNTRQAVEERADRLAELQKAFLFISQDIEQMVIRPARDGYGDTEPPVRGGGFGTYLLEFTRTGWRNPLGHTRSLLQRVAYGIKDDQLIRYSWFMVDRAQDSQVVESVLVSSVRGLEVRFFGSGEAQSQWPPAPQQGQPAPVMPKAVEITLELTDMGKIIRLLAVAGADS